MTRARILDAAIGLFRRQGFEATTMREIAAEAGVAIGAAYYYFESKNAIVLAFYDRSRLEMAPLLEEALASSRDLRSRLAAVIEVKLRYFEPNRDILAALAGRTDPADPLSPFSEQTREIRDADIEVFARAIAESRTKDLARPRGASSAPALALPDGHHPVLDLRPFARTAAHPQTARFQPRPDRRTDQEFVAAATGSLPAPGGKDHRERDVRLAEITWGRSPDLRGTPSSRSSIEGSTACERHRSRPGSRSRTRGPPHNLSSRPKRSKTMWH